MVNKFTKSVMINSKEQYLQFLKAEQGVLRNYNFFYVYFKTTFIPTKRFLLLLRTCEYLKNSSNIFFN